DLFLDGLQLVAHERGHPLLENPLQRGRGHAAPAYLATTRSRIWIESPGVTDWTSATENFSRVSVTRAVATSSSSSPSSSPVTGCTMGTLSRRRLMTAPGRMPSPAVRSTTILLVST